MDPRAAIERIVRAIVGDTLYLRSFACTVERDHGDNHLDLLPDDQQVRGTGLSRVPIKHGLPGVSVRVVTGSRVLLGFVEGDPSKPYASLWDPGSIEELILGGPTGSPAARQGDAVEVLLPPAVFSGTVGGSPATGVLTFTMNKALGVITAGSGKVKVAP